MILSVVPPAVVLSKQRTVTITVVLSGVAIFCWFFPLFHIVRLDEKQSRQKQTEFDAPASAQKFWTEHLLPSLDRAANVQAVLTLAATDPQQVRKQFGRTVGLSREYFLFLRGSGTVQAIAPDGITVALDGSAENAQIVLQTGPLFGNAVRDATGLLNPSDFSNSRQFNDLSSELNSIVESKVTADLQANAKIGQHLEFVGCAEISDEATDFKPLSVVPVQIKLK